MTHRPIFSALTRRAALRAGFAAFGSAVVPWRALAQDRYDLQALLRFDWPGQISLLHLGALKGMLEPHYMRPSVRRIGEVSAEETLSGEALRVRYGIGGRHPMDYALTGDAFTNLAPVYGQMGGAAHVATVLDGIRRAQSAAICLYGRDGITGPLGHFAGGGASVRQIEQALGADVVLGGGEPPATVRFERNGVQIAVVQQSGAVSIAALQKEVARVRDAGAETVICLSDLSLAQGRTLARDVSGLDVICVNDVALPDAVEVGQTRVLSSGTQGRFVTRFDFDLIDGKIGEVEQVLIPVFADIIPPTPRIATKVRKARAPFEDALDRQLGIAGTVLYHADAVRCSWGDLICEAVRVELGCDMVLWPASDAGRTVRAGQAVRRSDVFSVTGKARMRTVQIKGGALKGLLEDEAQKVLAKTRYDVRRSGMVRVGGLAFTLDFTQTKGRRIRDLRLASGASLGPTRSYTLATTDLASGGDPEVANLVEGYISQRGRVGQGLASPIRVILPEV